MRARYHARDLVVEAASQRDPYAAADGTLAFEDRASLSTTWVNGRTTWSTMVYAARTRWWTAPDAETNIHDTRGAELAVSPTQIWKMPRSSFLFSTYLLSSGDR